ncbi:penta-EF hand family protein [Planomicrobium okeanokoites]|uniref:hypothetical protein n=1 Tax=Planomicrobium okeanokoites TaxID=244 RepID=UPI00361A29F9
MQSARQEVAVPTAGALKPVLLHRYAASSQRVDLAGFVQLFAALLHIFSVFSQR